MLVLVGVGVGGSSWVGWQELRGGVSFHLPTAAGLATPVDWVHSRFPPCHSSQRMGTPSRPWSRRDKGRNIRLNSATPRPHTIPSYTPHAGTTGDNRSDTEKQLWLGKRGEAPGGALGAGVRRELFKGPPDEWPNGGRPVPAALCGPPPSATAAGNKGRRGCRPEARSRRNTDEIRGKRQ